MIGDASVVFAGDGPEAARTIRAWRLRGAGGGPSAYLQAGLHADEIPGMLVLHQLLPVLAAEAAAGRLLGDVVVVPQANPIGIRQFSHGRLLGRFDRATGKNFNRAFPPAGSATAPGMEAWQSALLGLVAGADIVLDLHTDDEALPYLYVHASLWPGAADLAAAMGAEAALIWHEGGGGAFEDTVVSAWLARGTIAGKLTSTVELRGQADVDDGLARRDVEGLLRVLRLRGVLAGDARPLAWGGSAVPISHVQTIRAPSDGVVVFARALGERVQAGQTFARLIPMPGNPAGDVPLCAEQDGLLLTRTRDRYVEGGGVVAKLTGSAKSASWGENPLDD